MTDTLSSFESRPMKTATDQVFDALYHAVISLELPPGTKVSEVEISNKLGVSRQPVRDAFYRLSQLGFLLVRPQRATLVTKISEDAVPNAIFVRRALEAECLNAAFAKDRDNLITALQNNIDQQRPAAEAEDIAKFHERDEKFHQIICGCAGHPHVWPLILEQKAHLDRVRYLTLTADRLPVIYDEHLNILDALKASDSVLAEKTLRQHLSYALSALDRSRKTYPQYFEASK